MKNSWILLSLLNVVRQNVNKCYALFYAHYMNDNIRVRCAHEIRQPYIFIHTIRIPWKWFYRMYSNSFSFICNYLMIFLLISKFLIAMFKSCIYQFRSPCHLNAPIWKQPTATFSTGIHLYSPVETEERSKLI